MRTIYSSVFILFSLTAYGNPVEDTTLVSSIHQKIVLHEQARLFHSLNDFEPMAAWRESMQHGGRESASIGFTKDFYWAAFSIRNDQVNDADLIIEIGSPQIDKIFWYSIKGNRDSLLTVTGDLFPFEDRLVWNKNFLFPIKLKPNETKSFLFKIDKRNTSLYLPIFLWKPSAFEKSIQSLNLVYGSYFGVVVIYSLFALLAFIFLRSKVYLWYFLWIAFHGLYISANLGFSFQFLYPHTKLAGPLFSYTTYVTFICFIGFSLSYLEAKKAAPKATKGILILMGILLSMILTSIPFFEFYVSISFIVIQVINILLISSCVLLVYIIIHSFRINRASTSFYLGAFGIRVFNIVLVIMIEFGFIKTNFPMSIPSLIGSTLEMTMLALGFIYQIKMVYQERNEFLEKINLQKKEMLRAFIDGVDKERYRIAMDLHDNIGSRMSNLTRLFKNRETLERMEEQINILCDDIRTMSHELSPTSLGYGDLIEKLNDSIIHYNKYNQIKIDFQHYDFPRVLDENIKIQLYRVLQEAFENILKHANASEVDVQLFKHENVLISTIEDNGIGFDSAKVKNGIGLNNMKARIESMSGTMEITSSRNHGTQILIRVPL